MSKRNVPILSLLDQSEEPLFVPVSEAPIAHYQPATSTNNATFQPYVPQKPVLPTPANRQPMLLHNLVSRFQTSINVLEPQLENVTEPKLEAVEEVPALSVSEHIKRFQTSLIINKQENPKAIQPAPAQKAKADQPQKAKSEPKPPKPPTAKAAKTSPTKVENNNRTSINSIINVEEPEPKKRPLPKKKDDVKRRKVEEQASITSALANATTKKKKSVEPVDSALNLSMATDKSTNIVPTPVLPRPTVINLLNPMNEEEVRKEEEEKIKEEASNRKEEAANKKEEAKKDLEKSKEQEKKVEVPIIALNIPLVDPINPKPGQSEVVINVLRLSEEKYGWSVIHPKAKSAIDVMDDMIDDDDDEDGDEDDVAFVEEEKPIGAAGATVSYGAASAAAAAAAAVVSPVKKKELTEEQLVRQHEAKMNRKVGKYDFEDPFIDDIELQMQEEIISTKEGFFVYWGPLVDDRNSAKKGSSKAKK